MIATIIGALTSRVGAFVSAGLAVALLVVVVIQNGQINGWPILGGGYKAQVATLTLRAANAATALTTCHDNTATLSGSLAAQNVRIAALGKETAAATKRAAAALAQAVTGRQTADDQAAAILAAKPSADLCQSADELILRSVK